MTEPALRTRIRRGLLKVEQMHALARDVFYGNRGRIDARELWEQMNSCSCLTLIVACIIYWQAKEMSRVIRRAALLHGSTRGRSGVEVADDHAGTAEDCALPSANILFSTAHPTIASRCCASNPFARRLPPRIRLYRRNVPSTRACCR